MVGLSSRFFKAGYTVPKYQLLIDEISVFFRVVDSFRAYFETDKFLFLCRPEYLTEAFVHNELERLGLLKYEIKIFDNETRGQAETVYLGTKDIELEEQVYIFNIDTFRPGFLKPDIISSCDGYLEVFDGEGDHWSFVLPGKNYEVQRTTEKERISNLCSDGLYYFRSLQDFRLAFEAALSSNTTVRGEYYIAPLYNYLIQNQRRILYKQINPNEVVFCGTPDEYKKLIESREI